MDYTIEGIVGVAEREALAVFAEPLDHSTQPQYQYPYKWRPGDLVI
jgi:alpha-ketoglutarate-dependent taurine dioxygenase